MNKQIHSDHKTIFLNGNYLGILLLKLPLLIAVT